MFAEPENVMCAMHFILIACYCFLKKLQSHRDMYAVRLALRHRRDSASCFHAASLANRIGYSEYRIQYTLT